jgi:hypothetical protein
MAAVPFVPLSWWHTFLPRHTYMMINPCFEAAGRDGPKWVAI